MIKMDNKNFSESFTYGVWFLMAFQAGYVNIGGLFTSGIFVSHVTGTSSSVGKSVAEFDLIALSTFFTVLLAFIVGAAFAGYHIGKPMEENKEPRYLKVLSVKSLLFGIVLFLSSGVFDYLPANQIHWVHIGEIFILSFCCGIQNSTCALATNGFLKPTHMTGLSTDLGIFFSKLLAWKKNDPEKYREERHKNFLRLRILMSFIFGGVMATFIFEYNGHYGFLFPFVSSLCFLAIGTMRDVKKLERSSWQFATAKGSLIATFAITLLIGANSLARIFAL